MPTRMGNRICEKSFPGITMGVALKNFQTPNHYNTLEPIMFRAASAPVASPDPESNPKGELPNPKSAILC